MVMSNLRKAMDEKNGEVLKGVKRVVKEYCAHRSK
jgi:hypothetical protein